jgi:hypothetical protein
VGKKTRKRFTAYVQRPLASQESASPGLGPGSASVAPSSPQSEVLGGRGLRTMSGTSQAAIRAETVTEIHIPTRRSNGSNVNSARCEPASTTQPKKSP